MQSPDSISKNDPLAHIHSFPDGIATAAHLLHPDASHESQRLEQAKHHP